MIKRIDEESWNRFPEARFRTRESGIKLILEGLDENGFCSGIAPRIHLLDDGIYIDFTLNVGQYGNILALPIEVFIPVNFQSSSKKKKSKEKKINEEGLNADESEIADDVYNKSEIAYETKQKEAITTTET